MVIWRDLSEANEGDQNPLVGTPFQRQVRDHFTRADGSLNYSGYFAELLGVYVSSSELDSDSDDDDSDNSSGHSSDCVIISPSPFT
jgi:hypothetical protein